MAIRLSACILIVTCLLVAGGAGAQTPASPAPLPADVASLDAVVAAVYDVISGPPAQPRNWDRFRSLFVPGARLIPTAVPQTGPAVTRVLTAEDYAAQAGPRLEKDGFFEREVARKVERYGHIAHVFSTYESRHAKDEEKPFARGINSFQLFWDGTRWWIVTIYWDAERPGQPIPAEYLPKK